jgi:hypothetical protein
VGRACPVSGASQSPFASPNDHPNSVQQKHYHSITSSAMASRPGDRLRPSASSSFEQWVYGIGRSHHGRHGKMATRRDSSARSDGIVLTMLLCSATGIAGICSILTKNITTRLVRTYRYTRTRRSRVPSRLSVARWRCSSGRTAPPVFQSVSFRQATLSSQTWDLLVDFIQAALGVLSRGIGARYKAASSRAQNVTD